MSIPTKNYGPEFLADLADLQAEADSSQAPEGALPPEQLADKCEAWLQAGGASNIVDAYEAGYRDCEAAHAALAAQPKEWAASDIVASKMIGAQAPAEAHAVRATGVPADGVAMRSRPERFKPNDGGKWIDDDDFGFDAMLKVDGDFGSDVDRLAYAQFICDKLNADAPDVQPKGTEAPALPAVAEARGFVAFGAGVYRVCQTVEPGLVVTFRHPGEEDRAVGERNAAPDLTPIPPEEIIVRLEFRNVAGLDSLEDHLREIRQQHWPETVPNLLVDAMAHANANAWAVTKEWARGWNDARLAIAKAHLVPSPAPAPELDVRRIMLDVVPGEDGMGEEVYAKSVADVEAVLTRMGERIEELESRTQAPAVTHAEPAADQPGPRTLAVEKTCKGCPQLKTESWTEYLENDETDHGTSATCGLNGEHISSYWHEGDPPPRWCPAASYVPVQGSEP